MNTDSPNTKLKYWLLLGISMVLIQILIGGITRLTDSGLSITEWNVIKGVLPPLNETDWHIAFDKYKNLASRQYQALHSNMTLSEFKVIYYWEYFHRLWARMMGIVFIIPFVYFLYRRMIPPRLLKRLLVVIFLASLSAVFGWVMVSSGLNSDKRTWVSAYKLMIHLGLATSLIVYLFYTFLLYSYPSSRSNVHFHKSKWILPIGLIILIQIFFGALMAGMRAGLVFPYPFLTIELPQFLTLAASSDWNIMRDFIDYEPSISIKLLVQVLHRTTAYLALASIVWFGIYNWRHNSIKCLIIFTMLQVLLGIITITMCIGKVPVIWGVVHQITAFAVLLSWVVVWYARSANDHK